MIRKIITTLLLFFLYVTQAWGTIFVQTVASGGATAAHTADMEENDLTDFDSTTTDGGDLSVSASAALNSTSYGLDVLIDDSTAIYGRLDISGTDFTTNGEFKVAFYLDPNSLTMANSDRFSVGNVELSGSPYNFLIIYLEYDSGTYSIRLVPYNDSAELSAHSASITDASNLIEVEITRATTDSAADGQVELLIDGSSENTWSSVDNYDAFSDLDLADFGAKSSIDAGTSGTLYIDEIEVYDDF